MMPRSVRLAQWRSVSSSVLAMSMFSSTKGFTPACFEAIHDSATSGSTSSLSKGLTPRRRRASLLASMRRSRAPRCLSVVSALSMELMMLMAAA